MRLAFLVFCYFTLSIAVWAARTDTVYLYNGDRITGEIKFLNGNKLSFKTDRAGTIAIEWPSIVYIHSTNYFDISTVSGERLFGSLGFGNSPGTVIIVTGLDKIEKNLEDIISINRVRTKFLDQLTGSLFLNVNYTQANRNLQFNTGFDVTHRSRRFLNAVKANTLITSTATTERSERSDASYNFQRIYGVSWFIASALSFQRNTELNIASRYQLFAGGGKYFLRKASNEFYMVSGFAGNLENSFDDPVSQTENVEFVLAMNYHQFKFRNPQFDIAANINSYTSFNVPGRIRFDAEVQLMWELFSDFKWNITFYENFDRRPPGSEQPSNDWNISTGFTYTL